MKYGWKPSVRATERVYIQLEEILSAPDCWMERHDIKTLSPCSTLSTESAASMQSVFHGCPAPSPVIKSHSHNHPLAHQLSEPRRHGPLLTPQDVFIHRLRSSRSSVELSSSGASSHSSSPSPSIAIHGPTKSQPTVYNPYENCFYI